MADIHDQLLEELNALTMDRGEELMNASPNILHELENQNPGISGTDALVNVCNVILQEIRAGHLEAHDAPAVANALIPIIENGLHLELDRNLSESRLGDVSGFNGPIAGLSAEQLAARALHDVANRNDNPGDGDHEGGNDGPPGGEDMDRELENERERQREQEEEREREEEEREREREELDLGGHEGPLAA